MRGVFMVDSPRRRTAILVALLSCNSVFALSLLPLTPAVLPADAIRTADHGFLGNVSVADFEVNITGAATWKNTTLTIPIHKDALITSASVNLTGKPELSYVTILGQGDWWDD